MKPYTTERLLYLTTAALTVPVSLKAFEVIPYREPLSRQTQNKYVASQLISSKSSSISDDDLTSHTRSRRANDDFFEELRDANIEEECNTEKCSPEEALEWFQSQGQGDREMRAFWKTKVESCRKGAKGQRPCHKHNTKQCHQGWGKHKCVCKKGWSGDDCTKDIKECLMVPPPCLPGYLCADNSRAENDIGYTCAPAGGWKGWTKTSEKKKDALGNEWIVIENIDECNNEEKAGAKSGMSLCQANQECKDTPGDYKCDCKSGYMLKVSGVGDECVDIDECSDNTHNCDKNAKCENNSGSFECKCNDGYHYGVQDSRSDQCVNINECLDFGSSICDDRTTKCTDTIGSYTCDCLYSGTKNVPMANSTMQTCVNIDECATGNYNCPDYSTCRDLDSTDINNHYMDIKKKPQERTFECVCDDGKFPRADNITKEVYKCVDCGWVYENPAKMTLTKPDGTTAEVDFADVNDVCNQPEQLESCVKNKGKGWELSYTQVGTTCSCGTESKDDDKTGENCGGKDTRSKNENHICQCNFEPCKVSEWSSAGNECQADCVEGGKDEQAGIVEEYLTCDCPSGNDGKCIFSIAPEENESRIRGDKAQISSNKGLVIGEYEMAIGEKLTRSVACKADCSTKCDFDPTVEINTVIPEMEKRAAAILSLNNDAYRQRREYVIDESSGDISSGDEGGQYATTIAQLTVSATTDSYLATPEAATVIDATSFIGDDVEEPGIVPVPTVTGKTVVYNTPFTEWAVVGACSSTCGAGLVTETRQCKPFCSKYCKKYESTHNLTQTLECSNSNGLRHPPCATCTGSGAWSEWTACMPKGTRSRRRDRCDNCSAEEMRSPKCYQEEDCIATPLFTETPQPPTSDPSSPCDTHANCQKCQQICHFNTTRGECGCGCLPGFTMHCDEATCLPDKESYEYNAPTSSGCPDGNWFNFDGRCYLASETTMSYEKSQEFCAGYGAKLAVVTSREANFWLGYQFLENKDVYWLGLESSTGRVGTYRWVDGTPFGFNRWYSSHPKRRQTRARMCVMSNWSTSGEWYSLPCDGYSARAACSKRSGYV